MGEYPSAGSHEGPILVHVAKAPDPLSSFDRQGGRMGQDLLVFVSSRALATTLWY